MALSPSRMPQSQNVMGAHSGNLLGQPTSQTQFLPQNQFSASSGVLNVNSTALGKPAAQAGVVQVSFAVNQNLFDFFLANLFQ